MVSVKMTELQLELLRIYSFDPSTEDLIHIKNMLGQYFANKLSTNIEKSIEQNKISDQDLEKWLIGKT